MIPGAGRPAAAPDPSTATNALIAGEADWQEYAYHDQLTLLRRARNVRVATNDPTGFVGMMQVNNWWMERFAIDPFSLLDPATNERWGKWILAEEISRHGLSWKAVGKYHSPDPERGRQYAWLVYRHYAGQRASKVEEVPRADQETDTQNVSDPRGTRADQGVGQQSGVVPLHVQQKGVPWVFRPKSGTSGGKD